MRHDYGLQEAEKITAFAFQRNPLPMWIYDLATLTFLDVNEAAIAKYGYTREEFLAMTIKDIRPPEEVERLLRNVAAQQPTLARTGVWKHVTKAGEVIEVEIISNVITFDGKPARLVHANDVTERVRSERSLLESSKLQQLLMHMATDFVNIPAEKVDESIDEALATIGMFVSADRAYLFEYDFATETMSNTHEWCAEGISHELPNSQNIPNSLLPYLVAAHRRGEVYVLPRVSELPANDSFRQILEPQGIQSLILFPMIVNKELLGFVGFDAVRAERVFSETEQRLLKVLAEILANAEARRRSNESLRESEEKYRALVENTTDFIWEVDANSRYTYASPQIQKVLGYAPEEVIGKTPFDLMPPNEAHRVGEIYENLRSMRAPINALENTNWHRDGRIVVLETSGVPLIDRANVLRGYRGIDRDITERKRAQESLRASDIKFRTVVENAQAIVFILDRDGVFQLSEGKELGNIGLKPGEVVGRSVFELFKDYPTIIESVRRALNGELTQSTTEVQSQIFDTLYTPVSDQHGELSGVVGIATDITELRRATEELAKKELRYRTLFDLSPAGIMLLDEKGTILEANDAYRRSHLYGREELIGNHIRMLVPKELWHRIDDHLARILAGETLEHEVVNIRKDGSSCVVELRETTIVLQDGRRGILSAANDVTARKQMEEVLRATEERYRHLFEVDPTAVVISTPDGRIGDCNPAFIRIFGFSSREEVLNANPTFLYEDAADQQAIMEALCARRMLNDYEVTMRRLDGTKVHISANVIGTFDENGALVRITGYLSDITVQKQLERQLVQSQKLESIGTLASGIAHDFNNILGIILGHASLLTHPRVPIEKAPYHANAILKATERGAGVVKQLLAFARKGDVHLQPTQLNDIVAELFKLLNETFPKTIDLELHLEEPLPMIVADANQMHQVILNLCVNARDAMPSGGQLRVTTSVISQNELQHHWSDVAAERYVQLSIADTGMGMDEATRLRIFEPFFTTKEHGKGTGLGLATVYGIVQTHKGWIDVQSSLGNGSTFNLYFPIDGSASAQESGDVANNAAMPRGKETILVVEDETMLQEMVAELLKENGYTVLLASNGERGLEQYESNSENIGLILSDLGLPVMGGDALYLAVAQRNPSVKFILASGFVDPQLKTKLANHGLHHFISKPYYPSQVLGKIREVLDAR